VETIYWLRTLAGEGIPLGNHSVANGHMARPEAGELIAERQNGVTQCVDRSHQRLTEEIGEIADIFAYPYGEDSPELAEIVAERYRFALAQRSGPIGTLSNPRSMPRFPMATGFASLDRLALAVDTRPLPVRKVETSKPAPNGDIDWIRLTVESGAFQESQLACYSGGGDALTVSLEPDEVIGMRIEVSGIGVSRQNKINCTAPDLVGSGGFYWHSHQWLVDRG